MRIGIRSSLVAAAAVAAAWIFAGSGAARAEGPNAGSPNAGSVGRGGVATGDISKIAGEADEISVQLFAGSTIDVSLVAAFRASLAGTDPDGAAFPVALSAGPKPAAKGVAVPKSGTYRFRVTSADGSQGKYTFTVVPKWPKKLSLTGAAGTVWDLALPAGAWISGKAKTVPAKSFTPRVASVTGPQGGELLTSPVLGKPGLVKIPKLAMQWDGTYRLTLDGMDGAGDLAVALKLGAAKIAPTKLDLTNGIVATSFSKDGVGSYLATRCVACHTWASGAATARSHMKSGLSRMQSGNMPQGGPRASAAEVALIRDWIATGMEE